MPRERTQPYGSVRPKWLRTPGATLRNTGGRRPNHRQLAAVLAVSIAVVVLCITAVVAWQFSGADPVPSTPATLASAAAAESATNGGEQGPQTNPGQNRGKIVIDPQQGTINSMVAVTGLGWWPGEPVFVFLQTRSEDKGPAYAYAAAMADDQGQFSTGFTFPDEMRWVGQREAKVVARGTRSGFESSTPFVILALTPTQAPPSPTELPAPPTRLPTATPQSPAPSPATITPAVPAITDWRGEYFANPALAGGPGLTRNDEIISFLWGSGSPVAGMPSDNFSVRWSRKQPFQEGIFRFSISMDDGARFWIDGQLAVDEWQNGPFRTRSFDMALSEGGHDLLLEYYENLGDAGIQLGWERTEGPPPSATAVPTDTPVPTSPPPGADSWQAEYFANPSLSGEPVLVREEAEVDFDWGAGSPGEMVPADHFSARWRRETWLPAGTHRVSLQVDDGARLWLDGQLLLDAWQVATGETYEAEAELSEGVHTLQVEYFEEYLNAHILLRIE